jgi:hypothetical protein
MTGAGDLIRLCDPTVTRAISPSTGVARSARGQMRMPADQERKHGAQHMKTPGMAAAVMASARVSAHD